MYVINITLISLNNNRFCSDADHITEKSQKKIKQKNSDRDSLQDQRPCQPLGSNSPTQVETHAKQKTKPAPKSQIGTLPVDLIHSLSTCHILSPVPTTFLITVLHSPTWAEVPCWTRRHLKI